MYVEGVKPLKATGTRWIDRRIRAMGRLVDKVAMHEITAGHRSLSNTISCVTVRIRFLLVTMAGRFSNFNSTSYTKDQHELQVTDMKCRLPDTMSGTGEISISSAELGSMRAT